MSPSEEIVYYILISGLSKWVPMLDMHINVCSWKLSKWLTRHLPRLLGYNQCEVIICAYKTTGLVFGSYFISLDNVVNAEMKWEKCRGEWSLSHGWETRTSFLKQCTLIEGFCYSYKTYKHVYFSDIFMSPFPNWIRVVFFVPTIYLTYKKINWYSITRYVNGFEI